MAHTMHLFSKFATEIRLNIWQYAMVPRVVRANWPSSEKRTGSKNNPVLLFVNQESRREALRHYKRLDGDIYIDFSRDTVFMDSCFLGDAIEHPDLPVLGDYEPQIQILAIDYEFWAFSMYLALKKIHRCRNIRKLLLVMPGHNTPNWLNEALFYEPDNVLSLVAFQDLNPQNYNFFYLVSSAVTNAIRLSRNGLHAHMHWPDVYLVTYSSGAELVRSPDWLIGAYLKGQNLEVIVKENGRQQRGYGFPVPVFEMRMLLE